MPPLAQATAQGHYSAVPADAYIWAGLLDSLRMAGEQGRQLHGHACARRPRSIAADTMSLVTERSHALGPLINLPCRCVEVLVPRGSAATWPLLQRQTVCSASALMRCPALDVTRASCRWVAGRTWTRPPATIPATTSVVALAAAVPESLARWHGSLMARIEGWAGDRPTPCPHRKDRP